MDSIKSLFNKENIKRKLKILVSSPGFKTFISIALAVASGLLLGLLVLLIANPKNAFPAFAGILAGSFGEPRGGWLGFGDLLYYATPLIFTGLSVGFAYKTGLFNIGASGQFMVAQLVAVIVGLYAEGLGVFQWPIAILAGIAAGAIWGFFPGIFKALFNVNEVITSIMFNYIGMYLRNMLIYSSNVLYNPLRAETHKLPDSAFNPKAGLDFIFPGSRVDIGIIFAIIVAIAIYIVLKKTIFGYELIAVGHNREASRYAGINAKRKIVISMVIAGALAGLGGALQILAPGAHGLGNRIKPVEVIAPEGFNGIPVALLGLLHPIGIVFSALFITYIQRGGNYIQSRAMIEIIDIIIALIIYFSAFALLFQQIMKRRKDRRIQRKLEANMALDSIDANLNESEDLGDE